MQLRIELHGVRTAPRSGGGAERIELELAGDSTAGDLLELLAERCGSAFRRACASVDDRLPRHIRMFAGGAPLTHRRQPLVEPGERARGVTVVLLSPMAGG